MNIKCLLGFHKWEKYMGYENVGSGKFRQRYNKKSIRPPKKSFI